jgi:hypothetical protein|nr:hypothetical protein [Ralstonia sp. LMG 18101]
MAALAEGCWKLTVAALPRLKLCQLTTAFCEVCVTFIVLPLVLMLACPAVTCPPMGSWFGAGGAACARPMLVSATTSRLRARRIRLAPPPKRRPALPRPRAVSATTIQARTSSLQTRR